MRFENIDEYIKRPRVERQKHIDLSEACIEIGGNSTAARLLMAHYLGVTNPKGMKIHLCHACHNGGCSNPRHLSFGTAGENMRDSDLHSVGGAANARSVKRAARGRFQ